jgi:hypothetical protein
MNIYMQDIVKHTGLGAIPVAEIYDELSVMGIDLSECDDDEFYEAVDEAAEKLGYL